jgi:hypothetical protein
MTTSNSIRVKALALFCIRVICYQRRKFFSFSFKTINKILPPEIVYEQITLTINLAEIVPPPSIWMPGPYLSSFQKNKVPST